MKYFKHGDQVMDTDINAIINAINAAEVQSQFSSYTFGCKDAFIAGTVFFGIHNHRWLIYRSTGEVRTLDFVAETETTPQVGNITVLPDCNDTFCLFDLHTVEWLKYGDVYEVEGSEFALEVEVDA